MFDRKPIVLAIASLLLLPVAGRAATVLASYDFADGLGPTSLAAGISASSVSVTGATLIFPTLYSGNPRIKLPVSLRPPASRLLATTI